jgi:hypothetical protein
MLTIRANVPARIPLGRSLPFALFRRHPRRRPMRTPRRVAARWQAFPALRGTVPVFWVDPLFDRDQHRTAIRLDLATDGVRSRPAPVCSFQRRSRGSRLGRRPMTRAAGNPTIPATCPQSALAARQASKECRYENRETVPSYPLRKNNLRRDVEARQHGEPASGAPSRKRKMLRLAFPAASTVRRSCTCRDRAHPCS